MSLYSLRRRLRSIHKLGVATGLQHSYYRQTTRTFSTILWNGVIKPFSEYADHVTVGQIPQPITVHDAIRLSMGTKLAGECSHTEIPSTSQKLNALQLLQLGSIWYLPKIHYEQNQKNIPHATIKPTRLTLENAAMLLEEGDYLRIHHSPRRFPRVAQSNWTYSKVTSLANTPFGEDSTTTTTTTGSPPEHSKVIVHSGSGFWIIDKPPNIPVHATVDNAIENVVYQIKSNNPTETYVATTQRIDVATSGLLVVATKPQFAAYFAQLLRHKTKKRGHAAGDDCDNNYNNNNKSIIKMYKCLVCLRPLKQGGSIHQIWYNLADLQGKTIRHFLEPSNRAPRRFEFEQPTEEKNKWLECSLVISKVSSLYPILNSKDPLACSLWTLAQMPENTKAVCEVEIQLETGRTHQIRGQMALLGFPIVGDDMYGGAIPTATPHAVGSEENPQQLALQCCRVGFWDADYTTVQDQKRAKALQQGTPSNRWVEASLESAWWTPLLKKFGDGETTTSSKDAELLFNLTNAPKPTSSIPQRLDWLPPTVQLSPGRNKYVLVKVDTAGGIRWFVRSASPQECGGPYHANVAQDLVESIRAAGFENLTVTGGGRIDYNAATNVALVFGFSYGFGKGDHVKVVQLLSENGISASYDDSDDLY